MPTLESLPLWKRLLLALLVLLVVALFVLVLSASLDREAENRTEFLLASAYSQPVPTPEPAPNAYQGLPLDATLLRLDKRALDEAYHMQILKLFGVWLASGAPTEAENFIKGLRIARRAYAQAATQITKRESQLLEEEHRKQEEQPR